VHVTSEDATHKLKTQIENYLLENEVDDAISAISRAFVDARTAAVSDAIAHAIGSGANTSTIIDAITLSIVEHGEAALLAVVEAFAAIEIGYSEELSSIFVEALYLGGLEAEIIASVIAEAVSKYECSVFA